MTLLDALLLGILQGITEFLPISSSGHLILAESFMNLSVENLKSFDIAIHFGTLLAIFIYFWKDYISLFRALFATCRSMLLRKKSDEPQDIKNGKKLMRYLIVATMPAITVGFFFGDLLDTYFRNSTSVAIMLIIVGIFFFVAEHIAGRIKKVELNQLNSFVIGLAQTCALIPGVSRSGATISSGLIQGIKRDQAARFSFLLGSVAITAAVLLSVYKVLKGEFSLPAMDILLTGVLSSFVAGYLSIAFLMKFLKKHTLHVFALYRIALGLLILYLL